MYNKIATMLIGIGLLAVLLPMGGWAQDSKVGDVERIVQSRTKKVKSTNDASIFRLPEQRIWPVEEGQDLHLQYTLELRNQLWMELKIDRPDLDLKGHAILAEAGSYRIDSLSPDKALFFQLRQGRMSIRLKRGEFGVFLKDRLLSILGTEVLLQADTTLDTYRIYLKKGHIKIQDSNQVFLDVNGKDLAWRLQSGQAPQLLTGQAVVRLKEQMKYDTRTVWRKPFFKQTVVRLGIAALVGGAVYYVVQRRDPSATAQGEVIINIPD